ncbi:hypothetical protein GWI33_018900 [Rhynchophorus ferrugineus]|uniref:Uncharacterized protein n=1 Tax=Rhynchophorus ferrugineus TaxID=354439 RepID=A0A834HSG7_RHYFE|nr:hypothetical protein GWI33_018900 [Rhynchophorus ferrugineus]
MSTGDVERSKRPKDIVTDENIKQIHQIGLGLCENSVAQNRRANIGFIASEAVVLMSVIAHAPKRQGN